MLLAALLGLFIVNIFYVETQLYLLMMIIIALVLADFLIFILSWIGLKISFRVKDEKTFINASSIIDISMSNAVPLFLCNCRSSVHAKFSNDDKEEIHEIFLNAFLDKCRLRIKDDMRHAGIYKISIDQVWLYDLFKFVRVKRKITASNRIIVMPKIIDIDPLMIESIPSDMEEGDNEFKYGNGDSFVDIREYIPGDSLKRISWKKSLARPDDELMVKLYSNEDDRSQAILVNLKSSPDPDYRNQLDEIYGKAYSLGKYYLDKGTNISYICWNDKLGEIDISTVKDETGLDDSIVHIMELPVCADADIKLMSNWKNLRLSIEDEILLI